jgi:hypothetical protein
MPNFSGIWTVTQQMQAKGASTWPATPGAPTIGTATAGSSLCASVTFSAPACTGYPSGGITAYRVISTPGCFTNTGASSPIVVSGLSDGTSYTFKAQATNAAGYGPLSAASNSITASSAGSSVYTTVGTFTFIVPSGVTSVSAVVVGAGGGGAGLNPGCGSQPFYGAPKRYGGGGGSLRWQNNISVTPGESLTVNVGLGGAGGANASGSAGGQSYFIGTSGARFVQAPGGAGGTRGGSPTSRTAAGTSAGTGSGGGGFGGGSRKGTGCYSCNGNSGGGGAGGYQPCAGTAGCGQGASSFSAGADGAYGGGGGGGGFGNNCQVGGGGVGVLLGQGCNGAGGISGSTWGKGGSGGTESPSPTRINGGLYGGGGAGTVYNPCYNNGGTGGRGAVRIVWPGTARSYPSTCVGSP